jgi:IS30 family transposase
MDPKNDAATRAQVLTLLQKQTPYAEISRDTGYAKSTISKILATARHRGYDPAKDRRVLLSYVEDAVRTSRPKKCSPEVEKAVIEAYFPELDCSRALCPENC